MLRRYKKASDDVKDIDDKFKAEYYSILKQFEEVKNIGDKIKANELLRKAEEKMM